MTQDDGSSPTTQGTAHDTTPDWDPRDAAVLSDQLTAYDTLRQRQAVAYSDYLGWSLFRHEDVLAAVLDHETFSNEVSAHLSVPNGMDPPQHTAYRRIIEGHFTPELMAEFEPTCRELTKALLGRLSRPGEVKVMGTFARPFALIMQRAWLGWPERLEEPLHAWTLRNHHATLARDPQATAAVALEFDGFIRELLQERRAAGRTAPDDLTTRLMGERLEDRPLSDEEIVSILRNWTVGELSTIAASVGIIVHALAHDPGLQARLRADLGLVPAAVDEILRAHAPLIANRRRTTCPVTIGDRSIPAEARVTLLWASANRDEGVFGDPDVIRLDRDPADNLLYGAGVHVCPGAPLARLELRVVTEELLAWTPGIRPATEEPLRAAYPASGFLQLPLEVR